jgi:hypothetical protein
MPDDRRNLSLGRVSLEASDLQMCREFQRLRQEYERSLRVWAYYAFPLSNDVFQFSGRVFQLEYGARVERDVAARRLSAHKETCPVCTPAGA